MAKKKKAPGQVGLRPENGRPVPKEIQVKLTPQGRMARTETASAINREKTDLQKEFEEQEKAWKIRRAEYKNNIKLKQELVDKLLSEVKAGTAVSTEQVLLVLNHDAGVAEYHFDTPGEGWGVIETRPLEENERQTSLLKEQVDSASADGQEIEE